jgi:hypothetical protein
MAVSSNSLLKHVPNLLVLASIAVLVYAITLPSITLYVPVENRTGQWIKVTYEGTERLRSGAVELAPGATRKVKVFAGDGLNLQAVLRIRATWGEAAFDWSGPLSALCGPGRGGTLVIEADGISLKRATTKPAPE